MIAGFAPFCDCQARYTATPAVSMTGCVFTVEFSSASLPSVTICHKSCSSTSEASAKVLRTAGKSA